MMLDLKRLIQSGLRAVLEQKHCEKYFQASKDMWAWSLFSLLPRDSAICLSHLSLMKIFLIGWLSNRSIIAHPCPSLESNLDSVQLYCINKFPSFHWFSAFTEEECVFEHVDHVDGIESLNGTSTRCPSFHKWGQCQALTLIYFFWKIKIAILFDKMAFDSSSPTLYLLTYLDVPFQSLLLFLCIKSPFTPLLFLFYTIWE